MARRGHRRARPRPARRSMPTRRRPRGAQRRAVRRLAVRHRAGQCRHGAAPQAAAIRWVAASTCRTPKPTPSCCRTRWPTTPRPRPARCTRIAAGAERRPRAAGVFTSWPMANGAPDGAEADRHARAGLGPRLRARAAERLRQSAPWIEAQALRQLLQDAFDGVAPRIRWPRPAPRPPCSRASSRSSTGSTTCRPRARPACRSTWRSMHYAQPHLFVLDPLPAEDAFVVSVELARPAAGASSRAMPRPTSACWSAARSISPTSPSAPSAYVCSPFHSVLFRLPRAAMDDFAAKAAARDRRAGMHPGRDRPGAGRHRGGAAAGAGAAGRGLQAVPRPHGAGAVRAPRQHLRRRPQAAGDRGRPGALAGAARQGTAVRKPHAPSVAGGSRGRVRPVARPLQQGLQGDHRALAACLADRAPDRGGAADAAGVDAPRCRRSRSPAASPTRAT